MRILEPKATIVYPIKIGWFANRHIVKCYFSDKVRLYVLDKDAKEKMFKMNEIDEGFFYGIAVRVFEFYLSKRGTHYVTIVNENDKEIEFDIEVCEQEIKHVGPGITGLGF